MNEQEDPTLPIKGNAEDIGIDASPKKIVNSKTFQYFFYSKVYQFCFLFVIHFFHDKYYPWSLTIKDDDCLYHIILGVIPVIVISMFSVLFIRNYVEPTIEKSFITLTVTSILFGVFLCYLRYYWKYCPLSFYLFFLCSLVMCLIISLVLFLVKEHYLIAVISFLILGLVGFNGYYYVCFTEDYFYSDICLIYLSVSVVVYFYLFCMCLYIYYKNEECYNVMFFAASKSLHIFLAPIILLGIIIGIIIIIIMCCLDDCDCDCDSGSGGYGDYTNYGTYDTYDKEKNKKKSNTPDYLEKEKQRTIDYLNYMSTYHPSGW